jgi:hypothetical protein
MVEVVLSPVGEDLVDAQVSVLWVPAGRAALGGTQATNQRDGLRP